MEQPETMIDVPDCFVCVNKVANVARRGARAT